MSHIITIETAGAPFTNKEALRRAVERLGGALVEKRTFRWYGRWVDDSPVPEHLFTPDQVEKLRAMDRKHRCDWMTKFFGSCEFAAEFPGCAYDVGFKADPGGEGWRPVIDWFDAGGLHKVFGPGAEALRECDPLLQAYEAECVKMRAEECGLSWSERTLPDGRVVIECEARGW